MQVLSSPKSAKWLAVISLLIASVSYMVAAARFGTPYATHLGNLMQLEFLAVHAGAFLGLLIFWPPSTIRGHIGRIVGIGFFSLIYLLGAFGTMGWIGAFEFALMMGLTYGGVLIPGVDAKRIGRVGELGVRWLITMFVFMIVAGICDTPSDVDSWAEHRSVLVFGAAYFLVLALFESTGIYGGVRRLTESVWDERHQSDDGRKARG